MKHPFLANIYRSFGNTQVLSLAGNLTVSVMSIVSVSLLFRALSVADIGAWVLFMSVVGLADSFRAGSYHPRRSPRKRRRHGAG